MNGKIKIMRTSKKWLVDSIFDLMEVKSLENITVSEICDNAELSRRTFYRLFKNKKSLLEYYFDELIIDYENLLTKQTNDKEFLDNVNFKDVIYLFLNFWWGKRDNIVILIKQNLFMDMFLKNISKWEKIYSSFELPWHDEKNDDLKYISNFFIGGYINVISYWLVSDKPKSIEEVSDIIYQAINKL